MPEDTDPTEQPVTETPTEARRPADDEATLRDSGLRALEAERQSKRQAEKRAKQAEDELARLREATASDAEKVLLAAKREERDRILAEVKAERDAGQDAVRAARLETAIVRQAISRFHDLDDVLGELLRDETVVMGPDGKFVGIGPALTALEKRKPHWVKHETSRESYGAPAAGRSLGSPSGRPIDQIAEQLRAAGYGARI